jgi:hypothetical protein
MMMTGTLQESLFYVLTICVLNACDVHETILNSLSNFIIITIQDQVEFPTLGILIRI